MMTGFFRIIAAHSGEINQKSLLTGKIRLRKSPELPFHPCGGGQGHVFPPGTGHDHDLYPDGKARPGRDTKPGEECSCPEIDENKNRCNWCILSRIMMKAIMRLAMA